METSVRYLEFAVKCDRLAKLAKSEEDRMILKEMAEAWKKVAGEVDRNEFSTERRFFCFLLFPSVAMNQNIKNAGSIQSRLIISSMCPPLPMCRVLWLK